jgi:hypothetical protein
VTCRRPDSNPRRRRKCKSVVSPKTVGPHFSAHVTYLYINNFYLSEKQRFSGYFPQLVSDSLIGILKKNSQYCIRLDLVSRHSCLKRNRSHKTPPTRTYSGVCRERKSKCVSSYHMVATECKIHSLQRIETLSSVHINVLYRRSLTAVATASCRRCYGLSTVATTAKNPLGLRNTTTTATFKCRRLSVSATTPTTKTTVPDATTIPSSTALPDIYAWLYKQIFLTLHSQRTFTNAIDTARANLIIPRRIFESSSNTASSIAFPLFPLVLARRWKDT